MRHKKSLGKSKLLAMILALIGQVVLVNPSPAYAATSDKTLSKTQLIEVKNKTVTNSENEKVVCADIGAMCVIGTTLYCIKTDIASTTTALYTIKNYAKSNASTTSTLITNVDGQPAYLGHANGMTYYNGNFYIATMEKPSDSNYQITEVSITGEVLNEYKLNKTVYSIAYFKDDSFIVGISSDKTNCRKYGVVKFDGTNFSFTKTFYVSNTGFGTGQDIEYSDGIFYIPTWDAESKVKNKILRVNLSKDIVDGTTYIPQINLLSNTSKNPTLIYEIESLDIVGGKIICCTNHATTSSYNKDAIYKLSY